MANKKINELTVRTPALSDLMIVGDPSSGYSFKCTVTALATIIETDIADGFVTIATAQTISGAKTFSNIVTLTSVANSPSVGSKFLILNASNVVNYRTAAEVLSDIGGQGTLTLTTTGTSGAATLVANTLNIPQYQSVLTNPVTGTGTTNYVTKWTSSSAVGNSQIIDNGTAIGIGTAPSNAYLLSVAGIYRGVGVGNAARIELYDTQSGGATFFISPQESLGVTSLGTYGAFPILFITNATERIRIASAGDVTISTIANATTDTDKFLVSDGGVIKYRTGSEVLSDIGGASSSSISGTTNYIPKFTSSSAIGNSIMYEGTSGIGIGTSSPNTKLDVIGNVRSSNAGQTVYTEVQNDGLYSTGTDLYLLAPSTKFMSFYAGGSERLRISSTGNVSIGNTNNTYKLDVTGDARISSYVGINGSPATSFPLEAYINSSTAYTTSSRGNVFRVYNSNTSTDIFAGIELGGAGTANDGLAGLNAVVTGSGSAALTFYTRNSNIFSEKLRLDASGNLGLGVTPSAWLSNFRVLQIGNSNSNTFFYGRSDITIESAWGINAFYSSSTSDWRYANNGFASNLLQVNGEYRWFTAPSGTAGNVISFTQAMTLDASGRLGIGVTSMTQKFEVKGSAGSGIRLLHSNNNEIAFIQEFSGVQGAGLGLKKSDGTQTVLFNAGGDSYISGGNVGIGTTSPQRPLHVNGTEGVARFTSTASGNDGFEVGIGTSSQAFLWQTENAEMQFATNNTERMRISSGGNVGIGTTSPTLGKLQITGDNNQLAVHTNGFYSSIYFYHGASNTAGLWVSNTETHFEGRGSGGLFFGGATSQNHMTITSGGNVGIGTTSPSYPLDVNNSASVKLMLKGGSSQNGILFEAVSSAHQYYIGAGNNLLVGGDQGMLLAYDVNTAKAAVYYDGSANIRFGASNSSEAMRITSGGELLINTTSDAGDFKLQVNGKTYLNGNLNIVAAGDHLTLTRTSFATWDFGVGTLNSINGIHIQTGGFSALSLAETTGNATFYSSIKTAAPSGGTAAAWKFGSRIANTMTLDDSGYIELEVGGTLYKLALVYEA